jgi:hypothetical protein
MTVSEVIAEVNGIRVKFHNGANAHEFDNVLSTITAEMAFAKDGIIPEKRRERVRGLIRQLESMLETTKKRRLLNEEIRFS